MLEIQWQKHQAVLRSIVGNVVGSSRVDDVMQESFIRLLRYSRSRASEVAPFRLIRRIVWTTTIDHYRKLYRYEPGLDSLSLASTTPSPLAEVLESEEDRQFKVLMWEINAAIEDLEPGHKDAIVSYFRRSDKSVSEICVEKNLPYSTLRSRMLSGLRVLRKRLQDKGVLQRYRDVCSWL